MSQDPVTLYHNPRCSKSRQTKTLLEDHGIEAEVVEYLKTPPDEAQLRAILDMLGMAPRQLLRKSETIYKELNLKDPDLSDEQLIQAMLEHPNLIERPIVIRGKQAAIGRPPESVLEILK